MRAMREPIEMIWRVRPLRALLGVGFLMGAIQLCVIAFAAVLLVKDFGFTPVAAGSALAATHVAGIVGRITWGLLADKLRNGRHVLIAVTVGIAFFALALQTVGATAVIFVLVGLGATAIGWNGVFLAEVARLAPDRRVGDATAVILAATYLGVFMGPALFTAAIPLFPSYAAAFTLLALTALVVAGLLCLRVKDQEAAV
jgi:nitrate/nitrite transporter NarK